MVMDNKEIKEMFDKLQAFVEETIKEGKAEHKEIKELLQKLCDRLTNTKNTLDNHLVNTEKKTKSTREKISYIIAGLGMSIAVISLYINM